MKWTPIIWSPGIMKAGPRVIASRYFCSREWWLGWIRRWVWRAESWFVKVSTLWADPTAFWSWGRLLQLLRVKMLWTSSESPCKEHGFQAATWEHDALCLIVIGEMSALIMIMTGPEGWLSWACYFMLFPHLPGEVVRFYVSCLLLSSSPLLLLLNRDPRRTVFSVGPQPRPSTPSVPCRTSTTTIPAQCSLPDLNHDHPRPVFPAGPQPRVSTPSVPCRTSCRKIWDKECAEES